MENSAGNVVLYIQQSLYDGRLPDQEGYYCYSRKELAENSGISVSTFNRCKEDVVHYLSTWCDLASWAKYQEYSGEILYQNVSYEKGVLKFQRNPLTLKPELSFLWALPPLNPWFAYDCFDEKHRRRFNGRTMVYDAIPWSWDADQYETELAQARAAIQEHRSK